MEFLVEFEVEIPEGTPDAEVEQRNHAEARAAAKLADDGYLRRLWKRSGVGGAAFGIYRADSKVELDGLLAALPLGDWLHFTVIPLEPHPNDPPESRR
jgi:muconolactone D-isomerase